MGTDAGLAGAQEVTIVPVSLAEANRFVSMFHRHHKPVTGHKFSIGAEKGGKIVGVAIVGRPVARALDDGLTVEVVRCCTDGTRNACSTLYAAAWRAARAMGYRRIGTYTLPEEGGASLRGAGWRVVGHTTNTRGWNCAARPRVDLHPTQQKLRWEPV